MKPGTFGGELAFVGICEHRRVRHRFLNTRLLEPLEGHGVFMGDETHLADLNQQFPKWKTIEDSREGQEREKGGRGNPCVDFTLNGQVVILGMYMWCMCAYMCLCVFAPDDSIKGITNYGSSSLENSRN